MKICMVSGSYPPMHCGVGDQTHHLSKQLAAKGEHVLVLTTRTDRKTDDNHGVTVHAVVSQWSLSALWNLFQAICSLKPDICHLQYPSLGFDRGLTPNFLFALIRWRAPQIKCVVTLHEYATYTLAGRIRLIPALLAAHRIICTNSLDLENVLETAAAYAQKIQVIPLGSNVGGLKEKKNRTNKKMIALDRKYPWILHFGTVMPNKGWEFLLPALKRLKEQNFPVGVLVAGELAPEKYSYHHKIHSLIREYGLTEWVRFTGYLAAEDLPEVFAQCAVAVQPYTEGAKLNRSSLVTLLAHHRAVITVDPRIQMENLKHGRHYWGVLPHDPAALATGIRHVLSHPELVEKLQTCTREVADYFSWESIVKKYRAVYQQLINS
ncbi:glycosyltransferase family 4 protein [bacterium]|nr:glycosyltransferase family 4 protein [bacterium]